MIGIDIVEISRIRALIGDKIFTHKVFTPHEIDYCEAAKSAAVKAQRYAARFAAKEAVFKAIEPLKALIWQEIEVQNEPSGKPVVSLSGKTKHIVDSQKWTIEISLSHSRSYAVAAAVIR